jgi:hypothetical protein
MDTLDMAGHLIRRLHQQSTQVFVQRTQEAGYELTPVQFAALDAIHTHPHTDQARVAEMIALDRATIGGVIERLEQKGWIRRVVTDARASSRSRPRAHASAAPCCPSSGACRTRSSCPWRLPNARPFSRWPGVSCRWRARAAGCPSKRAPRRPRRLRPLPRTPADAHGSTPGGVCEGGWLRGGELHAALGLAVAERRHLQPHGPGGEQAGEGAAAFRAD